MGVGLAMSVVQLPYHTLGAEGQTGEHGVKRYAGIYSAVLSQHRGRLQCLLTGYIFFGSVVEILPT